MKVIPINNNILVKKIKTTQTKSGIILPEKDDGQIHKCEVVSCAGRSQPVSEGNVVIIDKYAGKQLEVDGVAYTLVKADDILAILRPDE